MMRKSVFLTLLIALFSTATAWAEFNPTPGVKYALKEKTSELYLDIQKLGFGNSWEGADNISLSSQPCAIYFEAGNADGTWKMKNTQGQYVYVEKEYDWNPRIGHNGEPGYDWIFSESNQNLYTIACEYGYIHQDEPAAGVALWSDGTTTTLAFELIRLEASTQTYTFHIDAPQGESVTVKYGEDVVSANQTFAEDFNEKLFTATNLDGYTWEVVVDRVNHTITLVYTQVVQGGELNGYYHIYYKNGDATVPLFIGYNTEVSSGHKILGQDVYSTDAEGDKVFAIIPQEDGYTIAAQGKSLLAPNFNSWDHIQFSDESDAAGVYLFHETSLAGVFKIQGVGKNDGDIWLHNDFLQVYNTDGQMIVGPNPENAAHDFLIAPVTSYTITIPEGGVLPLCLPFNVELPTGVKAYDIDINNLSTENFIERAKEGDILKAGTPVILKGAKGNHILKLSMNNDDAIGALDSSVLRGNFVKETVHLSNSTKRFVMVGDVFEAITSSTEIPANSCWIEADINSNEIELVPKYITVDTGWKFRVKNTGKGLTITECVGQGSNSKLIIGEEYKYTYKLGEEEFESTNAWEIIAISDQLLAGNEFITEVHFPKTLTSVGSGYANYMFEMGYNEPDNGAFENIGVPENTGTEEEWTEDEQKARDDAHAWVGTPHTCKYNILGTSTWRMTVEVTKSADAVHFNDYGSCLLATKEKTLADDYEDGSMQLYLRSDKGVAFKLDTDGDLYVFNRDNKYGLSDEFSFTFVLENDGAGGYKVKVEFDNGEVEDFEILAADHAELHNFNTIWTSLGSGIDVNVKFEKLTNKGLFVGCKNLTAIHVHEDNPSFTGCDHGVLYNKSMTHIIRFPEGGGEVIENCGYEENGHRHFETPRTVTMVYAGALHGVNVHVVFHSNPHIMHVDGHEGHMIAKYHLVLDDDSDVIDFVTANANTFETFHYRRAPLAEGKFGTVMLPFVPENAQQKYEFFELLNGDDKSIFFTRVADGELQANVPYLFRLLEGKGDVALGKDATVDEFYSEEQKEIEDVGNNVPVVNGEWETVGCYNIEKKEVGGESDAYYGVNQGNLVRVETWFRAKPYRAYYKLKNASPTAPAKLVLSLSDGSTTEITPDQIEGWETPMYYDLMGRQVLNPTNGVYIVNGKKVVIK